MRVRSSSGGDGEDAEESEGVGRKEAREVEGLVVGVYGCEDAGVGEVEGGVCSNYEPQRGHLVARML